MPYLLNDNKDNDIFLYQIMNAKESVFCKKQNFTVWLSPFFVSL